MSVVLKLEVHNEKDKKKAMKTVSGLSGVDSVAMDMKGKGKELTITGDIDPVTAVGKLRKERVEIGDKYSGLNTSGKRQIVMEKVVFKLEILDDITKKKAMKSVSSLSGVDSIALNMKDKRMTIVGEIDPVALAAILRKLCGVDILNVGPTKWPEKKKEDDIRPKNELVKVVPGDTYCGLNTSINLQISKRVFELIRSEYNLVLGGMIISELDDSKELPREEKNWYNGGGGLDKDNGGKRKFVPKVGVTWIKRMVATPWFRRKKVQIRINDLNCTQEAQL